MSAGAGAARFSPWRVAVGSGIALTVGNGPVMQFTFGLFLAPIGRELALSRGTVSAALSIGLLATALAAPFVGRLMDRVGTVRVLLPAIAAFAATLALQGWFARGAASLFALSALTGIAAAGQTPIGYARAVVTWFDRHRGIALGVAMTGVGLGAIVMPMAAARLIAAVGWRLAYGGLALIVLALAVPAVALCIRERPVAVPRKAAAARVAVAWASPAFLKLALAFTLVAFAANGTVAHIVPMMTDRGVPAAAAAGALAYLGIALIVGRFLAGAALDRREPVAVTAAMFALPLAGIACLAASAPLPVGVVLVLIGLGLGAEVDLLAFLVGRFFPLAAFGQVYGALFALFMVGSSLGPLAVGLAYDRWGSYRAALVALVVAVAAAIAVTLTLRGDPAGAAA